MTITREPVSTEETEAQELELDLSWMKQRGEWGVQAQPNDSKRGLTVDDVSIGSYGEAPDYSKNRSGRPRGASARPDAYRVGGYGVNTKTDIWLKNAGGLYEEALQRQWSSATDIPWHTVRPLPDDVEWAECYFATFLTEVEFVAGDTPGKWVANTSSDYLEPKLFLSTQIMDEARHMDVFRKRSLANGGGLTRRHGGTDGIPGGIDLSRDFTEMSSRLHISGEGIVLTLFRTAELMGYNDAEKRIYRLCAQDESRHVAFGVMHLRYVGETEPERREEIHCYLDEAEQATVGPENFLGDENFVGQAAAILLGGGKGKYDEGRKVSMAIHKRQIKEYMQRIHSAGFSERFENGRANQEMMALVQS
ncbi:MAG: ferritin-like domain-containing protein [Dehalococcoidia bacterium]